MSIGSRIVEGSIRNYRAVTAIIVLTTVGVAVLAALPSVFPDALGFLNPITVDTDPENMLSPDEPVRVFHNAAKRKLGLHDMIVLGVVNEQDPCGVFNVGTLRKVYELAEFAKTLKEEEIGEPAGSGEGVVAVDLMAPSTVDSIEPTSGGVSFSWLMPQPPADANAALAVWRKARRVPLLFGTVLADTEPDRPSKAVALYLPLTRKDLSHRVYVRLQEKIASLGGPEQFHITGLPVAEDTFGVEMFIQMAISAPAAMVVIFLLMLAFFRKLAVIVSPMLVALVSVVLTMGALVIAGFPVHIMSSMIPIFIMPIAVLDSIHIISEFFERYQATRDRAQTIRAVMAELFLPMLYTSLTSAAGFASLALTPIPPVQVFGLFVALGILAAWVLTVTFIPAYVMFIPPRTLENFGATHAAEGHEATGRLARALHWLAGATVRKARPILAGTMLILAGAAYGISRIEINDNPVKWFTPSHPIRRADEVLNRHFGGTYMAYLALEAKEEAFDPDDFAAAIRTRAAGRVAELAQAAGVSQADSPYRDVLAVLDGALSRGRRRGRAEMISAVRKALAAQQASGRPTPPAAPAAPAPAAGDEPPLPTEEGDEPPLPDIGGGEPPLPLDEGAGPASRPAGAGGGRRHEVFEAVALLLDEVAQEGEVFKRPDVLNWIVRLQGALAATGVVGKTNGLADIVRTVHRDFRSGQDADYTVPQTRAGVGQMLMQFQNSHRPGDLWHFVTPDYRLASLWLQLTSGDNRDMQKVVEAAAAFAAAAPPPAPLEMRWFGLTYINVEWQEKMVSGMLKAFGGSFLVVFLLMTILFRSPLWGLLSMIPLTVTIAAIYGAIGLLGKDYDMPVAVLSSLTLGLAVDFAIHFLARSRAMYQRGGTWERTVGGVFGEPARAIVRNIIVIAAGFLPLLAAPLMPYKTVGVLMATILLVSGVATLLLLPALVAVLEKRLFVERAPLPAGCNCGLCLVSAAAVVALILLSIQPYVPWHWTTLTWVGAAAVPVLAVACGLTSRRQKCRVLSETPIPGDES